MRYPLITLTTDFGLDDHYVGAMKGVISDIAPRARIVDITHEIPPYAILEGAFSIAQAWRTFPAGTVHVVVVDPGVGSSRKALLAQVGKQHFVAPDNGVLSMILREEKHSLRQITASKYFRKPVSATFHGRDIFSPVAAHLASGVPASQFGPRQEECVMLENIAPLQTAKNAWQGIVFKADRYGNLITNFPSGEFAKLPFEIRAGKKRISIFHETFSHGAPGEIFVLAGSSSYLEIVANQASAAQLLNFRGGSPLTLETY